MLNPKTFWERKILDWEVSRYTKTTTILGRLAGISGASVRYRMLLAQANVEAVAAGRRVVELGCGSGILAAGVMRAGAASYLGIDISENALVRARERIKEEGVGGDVRFQVSPISRIEVIEADLVFSLGLLDWLSDREIEQVFALGRDIDYFHSFSERRPSPSQILHRVYVACAYGHRTAGYVPHYHLASEIEAVAKKFSSLPFTVRRDRRLSFGAMITSLPVANV